MDAASFAEQLRGHRLARGLTQEELAERAGLSERAISDLERGVKLAPRLSTLRLLVRALSLEDSATEALISAARHRAQRPAAVGGRLQADSPARQPNNLPLQPTPLIGRAVEVEAVHQRLVRPTVWLLTLTGTGGVGKTRVALRVAEKALDRFSDGVWMVPLAGLRDGALVPGAIAQTLGVREKRGDTVVRSLVRFMHDKVVLLVLDNFEHVLSAAATVAEVLAQCPRLKVLVTSRAPIRVYGEHEVAIPPLQLPTMPWPDLQQLNQCEAVQLFIERARQVGPELELNDETGPVIARICVRLDGLPLAIELAAAWIKLLPPTVLLARLDHRFQLLVGGPHDKPSRQQTLSNTLDWSYDLLGAEQRSLLRRLGVFSGRCTLEAVEVVCAATSEAPSQ